MTDNRMKLATMLAKHRIEANKSQDFMADVLGVSRHLVSNWELGKSDPTALQVVEWFGVLGIDPNSAMEELVHPETKRILIGGDEEKITKELQKAVEKISPQEKKILLYALKGDHGSDRYCILNMYLMNMSESLKSKIQACRLIYDNYYLDGCADKKDKSIEPDTEAVRNALKYAYTAIREGKEKYVYK